MQLAGQYDAQGVRLRLAVPQGDAATLARQVLKSDTATIRLGWGACAFWGQCLGGVWILTALPNWCASCHARMRRGQPPARRCLNIYAIPSRPFGRCGPNYYVWTTEGNAFLSSAACCIHIHASALQPVAAPPPP